MNIGFRVALQLYTDIEFMAPKELFFALRFHNSASPEYHYPAKGRTL